MKETLGIRNLVENPRLKRSQLVKKNMLQKFTIWKINEMRVLEIPTTYV